MYLNRIKSKSFDSSKATVISRGTKATTISQKQSNSPRDSSKIMSVHFSEEVLVNNNDQRWVSILAINLFVIGNTI